MKRSETWIDVIVNDSTITKEELESYRDWLEQESKADSGGEWTQENKEKNEYKIVSGMISDLNYSIDWLKRGRRPGNRRGIERQSIYQRTALLDTTLFPALDLNGEKEKPVDEKDKRAMIDILWTLSNRERQCYVLHMSYGMSYNEIAEELSVARGSVQKFVERAKKKVFETIS